MIPKTAMAYIQVRESGEIVILFNIKKGKVTLPGGKLEPNESVYDAVIREVKEEVNIQLDRSTLIDESNFILTVPRPWMGDRFTSDFHIFKFIVPISKVRKELHRNEPKKALWVRLESPSKVETMDIDIPLKTYLDHEFNSNR